MYQNIFMYQLKNQSLKLHSYHFYYQFYRLIFGEQSVFSTTEMLEAEFAIKEECIHSTFYMMVEDLHKLLKNPQLEQMVADLNL